MFSLVIPIYNEEKLIEELLFRTVAAIEKFASVYEVIVVDDGSTDNSRKKVLGFRKTNPSVKLLALSRNFGHQAAYTAGLEHTTGDIVAMMDGDLQDPPEALCEMYKMINEQGYEIVSGKRTGRKGSRGKNLVTWLFHRIFKRVGDIRNMGDFGNFSMMKRIAVDALLSMKEKVRYLPGLRTFVGFRQGTVEYFRNERLTGRPKMNFMKLFTLATDAIFSFSRFPVRFCLVLGTAGTLVFMAAGFYVLVAKAIGIAVPGWSSTLLSIYFLGSIQLVFLGVMGEYIFRNYKESQGRPLYFVSRFYSGEAGDDE
jgi:dolichol-phosphate mannosyltransferase